MASNPATALSIPSNVAAARQQVVSSDFFALCYLMLCTLAYTDENSGTTAVQQIKQLLPTMPVPPGQVQGQWSIGWGPVVSPDNANLMYAAEFSDTVSKLPVFAAVVIRGTDTKAEPAGLIKQLVEDLDAKVLVPFPENSKGQARIAQGTFIGHKTLIGFQDKDRGNEDIAGYLNGFLAKNPRTPIVVTGHSLGGSQTTVMAPYLQSKLPAVTPIVPNSFAAPTAGNAAFIQIYEQTFPFCPRWFNTFDLVPMAFADLGEIAGLWKQQCNVPCPLILKPIINILQETLRNDHYSQQTPNTSRILPGVCQLETSRTALSQAENRVVDELMRVGRHTLLRFALQELEQHTIHNLSDWVQELLFQHLPVTGYWPQVSAFQGVAPIPIPSTFERAAAATAGTD